MELGSAAALQAAERAHRLEPKDAKVFQLFLGPCGPWPRHGNSWILRNMDATCLRITV